MNIPKRWKSRTGFTLPTFSQEWRKQKREKSGVFTLPSFSQKSQTGFTLIELLVVIAIIAILMVAVVITLNPTEQLAKSRDSNRLSDLNALTTALNAYVADAGGSIGFSLGSSSVTYISIPDPTATTTAGTDCSGLGFPSGGSFHCAASSTYEKVDGTGWVPVDLAKTSFGSPLGSLPIDPVNQSSSNLYYAYQTNGTTFKLWGFPESQTDLSQTAQNPLLFTMGSNLNPDGGPNWILVPGNSTFGTSNFYVMKYDAVCSDNNGNYINDNNTGYDTYSNSGENCTPANNRQIASLPGGWPIANIDQTDAASYCTSIGAHLMTNNEWQTIAWNAENVASNWSGGVVGTNYIYSGHNDSAPADALPASSNDANGYFGETNTGGNQRRTLTLSNGSVIWDMAGNVWQWTNDTITGTNEPHGSATGWSWQEFPTVTTWGSMTQSTAGPVNTAWNSANGIGQLYSENATDATIYGFIRGGAWNNGANAGVGALDLYATPPYTNYALGFRCVR